MKSSILSYAPPVRKIHKFFTRNLLIIYAYICCEHTDVVFEAGKAAKLLFCPTVQSLPSWHLLVGLLFLDLLFDILVKILSVAFYKFPNCSTIETDSGKDLFCLPYH